MPPRSIRRHCDGSCPCCFYRYRCCHRPDMEGSNPVSGPQRFRKKPVEIQAWQWDGSASGASPIIDWILSSDGIAKYSCADVRPLGCPGTEDAHLLMISTLEGDMRAVAGDWIIRGIQGEFYPCRSDIFAATYEAVSG